MAKTKILSCKCKHEYQDAKYGISKRVHNAMKPGSGKYRCSICQNVVQAEEVILSPITA